VIEVNPLMLIVLAALIGLTLTALRWAIDTARNTRRTRTPLDDVLTLARRERGILGWRHTLQSLRIIVSGVPVATMVSGNWAALLTPGLRRIFHLRMRAREPLFKRSIIYPVDTSQRAFEEHQGIGELGTDVWNEFERTGRVSYDSFARGFKTTLTHHEYAMGLTIERKLIDDNLYPGAGIPKQITGRVEKIGDSAAVKREKSGATLFNNAFTASGTDVEGFPIAGPDGVALCSASHPNGPEDSGTQSNTGVLSLTQDNVTATRILMRKFKDDRGELISLSPDTLLVPPELEEAATIINNTARDVGTNFNDVNVQAGRWNIVAWDYLTDATRWFMLDSMLRDQHLVWYDRIEPEFDVEGDFDTLAGRWRSYMRYSRGFDDWRWIFGQDS
jgi:Mu-like prophage major head subunit gpT